MKAPVWSCALSCVLLVGCANGGAAPGFDFADAGGGPASDAAGNVHDAPVVPADAAGQPSAAADAADAEPGDAGGGGSPSDAAGGSQGDGPGGASADSGANAPDASVDPCAALQCSYGCANGACNLTCDGVDANCASFPGTYCDFEGAWTCRAYAKRGDYCGSSYDPKCAPPLTCQHIDPNGNYSPEPTCEP